MAKGPSFDTYLIAVKHKREPTQLYAVRAASSVEALEIVSGQAPRAIAVEIAGRLSRRMARPYKLKPGDPVLI